MERGAGSKKQKIGGREKGYEFREWDKDLRVEKELLFSLAFDSMLPAPRSLLLGGLLK
jgi:hypothetical protein